MMSEERQKRFLEVVDTWRLAAGVAFVAVIILTLFSLKLWVDLNEVVESRTMEIETANRQSVERCYANATNTPALIRVLEIIERQAVSPQEFRAVRNFRRVSIANAPTIRECRQLAVRLGVTIPKGVGG